MKGLGWVGKISKWGGIAGTIIPAGLLIVLGIVYIVTGGHNNMDMSAGFFPDLTKFDNYFKHFHIGWAGPIIAIALMFAAGIVLRYKMKDTPRPFRLGKGNGLMWILGVAGFAGSLLAFILSFIPPGQIVTGSDAVWYSVLIAGCIVMVVIPFIIYAMRKPSWRDPDAEFAPFHWDHK